MGFSKDEAAGFWFSCGICEVILAQIFWKKGVESMGPNVDKRLQNESLVSKITLTGFLYCGVGYFGYIQGFQKASHYMGVALAALSLGFGAMRFRDGNNFSGWVGLFD